MSKKLPTDVKKLLQKVAEKLPQIELLQLTKKDDEGEQTLEPVTKLIRVNSELYNGKTDKQGNTIKDGYYTVDSPIVFNHFKKMKKIYLHSGYKGVLDYVNDISDFQTKTTASFLDIINILNQIILCQQ